MSQKSKPPLLVLLDMHAILHRGFHALPDFKTNSGEPTGALYGLYIMLLSIIERLEPTYIIGCYDLPQPTLRHELFDAYKAGRKEVDPGLIVQIQKSREVLSGFGINYFESVGYEADDLLGTIVAKLQPELDADDIDVVIASGDHDTLQLVQADKVQVYTMRRGIKDTVFYGESEVIEKYGFGPLLLPDYKGLRGDPSDNIPGIKGIGEKTATTLITELGDLDTILETVKDNPEKLAEIGIRKGIITKLQNEAPAAVFSKDLATIRTDAPIDFTLSNNRWRDNLDRKALLDQVTQLQFRSLRSRIEALLGWGAAEEKTDSLFGSTKVGLDTSNISDEDHGLFQETLVMLWLLQSDQTNPTVADVERATKATTIKAAHQTLLEQIKQDDLELVFSKIERPLIPIVDRMNELGVTIDTDFLHDLEIDYQQKLDSIEEQIFRLTNQEFNIASPKQLSEVLFDNLSLPKKGIKKTSTGNYSTAESELEKLREAHQIIPMILEYRGLAKLIGTYISPLPKQTDDDGRLRATLVQWGTTTGRMSSRAPNLQNIPIRSELGAPIRKAFVPEVGKVLVAIDYSQIELRIAAWLSGDDNLKQVFISGQDIHAAVAGNMFSVPVDEVTKDMRSTAKTINFGILYGMGANALRANLNQGADDQVTRDQAVDYLDSYFESFPDLAVYQKNVIASAKKHGYTTTHFGRRRYFSTIKSKLPHLRAQAERMAINAPIQGTQADIIKLAMVKVSEYLEQNNLRDDAHLLLQVHDELVFEVSANKVDAIVPQLIEIMEEVVDLKETAGVVMRASANVGPNWGDMKAYDY